MNVAKPIGSLFGIGQKDDPTYNPNTSQAGTYDQFANNAGNEFQDAQNKSSDQLQNGAMTKGLFGAGGLNDRLGTEEQDLSSRGYQLQPQDNEAYGQAAGDISRQFGQQEQDASQSLARRGLGGGASGAAGATFAGLAGSKNEQLAKAQTDIAQKRMQDTQQRLQATRSQMQSLGMAGQNALSADTKDRFNARGDALKNAAGIESGVNDQGRQANEDAIGHKSKNIGDAWSEGTYSGTKSGTADATASWMKMGGSGSMGMSDERNKQNVTDGAPKVRSFLQGIANSHDYSVIPEGKTQGNDPQSKKAAGGSQSPFSSMGQKPAADGSYTASPSENAHMEQASSGLGPTQDGSGGMNAGGGTPDAGLTSMFGSGAGGGASGAGSGGMGELMSMFSDENNKKDIHDGDPAVRGFLDSVHPHEYEYKDDVKDHPLAGEGKHVSPMAQELEKTELGKQMVHDTPDGKVVDYGKGFGTMLAALGDLNKRTGRLEGKKK